MIRIQTLLPFVLSVCPALSRVCASDAAYNGSLVLRQGDGIGSAARTMPLDLCLQLKQWWRPCGADDNDAGDRRLQPRADDEEQPPLPQHQSCDEWLAMLDDSSTQETCFDSLILAIEPWGWYPIVRHQWLAMLQPCCGSTPHACAEHSVNPCADASSFKPLEKADNHSNTCAMSAYALSQLGPFNSTEALCSARFTLGVEGERTVYSFVEAAAPHCCEGRSICADFSPTENAAAPRVATSLLALLALSRGLGIHVA